MFVDQQQWQDECAAAINIKLHIIGHL